MINTLVHLQLYTFSYRKAVIRPQNMPKTADWGRKRSKLWYSKMAPQVQPKCFWHPKHMINNWQLKKRGFLYKATWEHGFAHQPCWAAACPPRPTSAKEKRTKQENNAIDLNYGKVWRPLNSQWFWWDVHWSWGNSNRFKWQPTIGNWRSMVPNHHAGLHCM